MSRGELALVAVQLRLELADVSDPEAFRGRIEAAADQAAAACGDAAERLLVFPEAVGHFLPLAFVPEAARHKATVAEAITAAVVRQPWRVALGMLEAGVPSARAGALFSMLPRADAVMRRVFGTVARRFRATVVAGSHLRARIGGRITNTSYTFGPDGRLIAETDKVNLVPTLEDASPGGLGLARGELDRVPIVDAAFGRLATLICYDGFREPHTRTERFAACAPRLDAAGVDILANPAANPWPWEEGWVFAEPGEDLRRDQQWQAEGLPATLAELSHVRYGVTAHLCGHILDQRFEGRSEILERRGREVRVLARASSRDRTEIVAARVSAPGAERAGAREIG
jgi:predicted amidohydrolase